MSFLRCEGPPATCTCFHLSFRHQLGKKIFKNYFDLLNLRRVGGQQINHQIYQKFYDIIFLPIKNYNVKNFFKIIFHLLNLGILLHDFVEFLFKGNQ